MNSLTHTGSATEMNAVIKLAEVLPSTQITSLNLNRSDMRAEGTAALAKVLPSTQITSISLNQNAICSVAKGVGTFTLDAINELCEALPKSSVTSLSLARNNLLGDPEKIDSSGACALCDALSKMKALAELNLSDGCFCDLEDRRLEVRGGYTDRNGQGTCSPDIVNAFCKMLMKSSVASLSVKRNNIIGDGAEKMAKAVLATPSMIDFGGIPIKPLRDNSVTDLDLSNRTLGLPEAMVLSGLLPGAPSLVKLNVDGYAIPIDELRGTKPVEAIDLSDQSGMSVASGLIIASCLAGNEHLKSLNVDGHVLPIDELRGAKPVEAIDLSAKSLGVKSALIIASCLAGNEHLKSLNLAQNSLSGDRFDQMNALIKLAEVLPSTRITSLNLDFNQLCGINMLFGGTFRVDAINALCEALPKSSVASLSMNFVGICGMCIDGKGPYTPNAIYAVCEMLPKSSVTSLSLNHNAICGVARGVGTFTLDAINALCEALPKSSVASLSLAGNDLLGDTDWIKQSEVHGESFEVGAKVVYQGREMTVSTAPNSDGGLKMIELAGIAALCDALPKMKALTELNLDENTISAALAEVLPSTTITSLSLAGNKVSAEAGGKLAEAFVKMPNLREVNLSRNEELDAETRGAIERAAPNARIEWDKMIPEGDAIPDGCVLS